MIYCVYFPDAGYYTKDMTLDEAIELLDEFPTGVIVNSMTGEIY